MNIRANRKKRKGVVHSCAVNEIPYVPCLTPTDRRFKDFTGRKFGKLRVIGYVGKIQDRASVWLCLCDCGARKVIRGGTLGKRSNSCGCSISENSHKERSRLAALKRLNRPNSPILVPQIKPTDPRFKDVEGQTFSRLTVIGYSGLMSEGSRLAGWACRCECGNQSLVSITSLTTGAVRSCGCLNKDVMKERKGENSPSYKHGEANSSWYGCYTAMVHRCTNPDRNNYSNYGGAGVKVHQEWIDDPLKFREHIGPRPSLNHSIDRYPDNTGNYEPGNVRWATREEQGQNTASTRLNADLVRKIRRMHDSGMSYREIHEAIGVDCTLACVAHAGRRLTWKNVA